MQNTDPYYLYDTVLDGRHRCFASLLPPNSGFAEGLPGEAIMGEFTRGPGDLTPDAFQQNTQFLQFMAFVISKHCAACPGLMAEAQRQQNGYVYILDKRTPTPDDAVPPEDIIGGVEIQDGQMIRYHGSPNYQLVTTNGFMQLDDWFKDRVVEELEQIAKGGENVKNQ